MQNFDVKTTTENAVQWIRDWFEQNGKGCNAVIGISGGKDSSIVAALCGANLIWVAGICCVVVFIAEFFL